MATNACAERIAVGVRCWSSAPPSENRRQQRHEHAHGVGGAQPPRHDRTSIDEQPAPTCPIDLREHQAERHQRRHRRPEHRAHRPRQRHRASQVARVPPRHPDIEPEEDRRASQAKRHPPRAGVRLEECHQRGDEDRHPDEPHHPIRHDGSDGDRWRGGRGQRARLLGHIHRRSSPPKASVGVLLRLSAPHAPPLVANDIHRSLSSDRCHLQVLTGLTTGSRPTQIHSTM